MDKIKRALAIWLLRQLGIDELHIRVIVGELSVQDAKIRQHANLIQRVYAPRFPSPYKNKYIV